MEKKIHIEWSQVFITVMLYATVLIYQGYLYGAGDQSQILPCLYAQDHPGFYSSDHYVTSYLVAGINERSVFHFILRFLGYQSSWMIWVWHVIFSMALIMAWIKIAELGIKRKVFQYLAVASILIVGFHTSVGGNELYYNSVIPSLVAKALASWALYFWLEGKYKHWIIGLIIASFIQPLVGLQLFLITTFALLLTRLIEKAPRFIPWNWLMGYGALMLPWYFLLSRFNGGHSHPEFFMDIMEFRLAHHFFPGSFGWFHWFVFGLMTVIVLRFYKHRLRWFMVLILLGCIVYSIGVGIFNKPLILYTQWFKTTIWLEAFAIIAVFVWLEKLVTKTERWQKLWMLIPVIILLLVSTYRLSGWFGDKPVYMLPFVQTESAEVDIALLANLNTPEEAVFIVPVEFSAFRWYSKRSLYFDYKALFHNEDFLASWYQRLQNIFAFSIEDKASGFELKAFSDELLSDPSQLSIDYWKSLGITHIVSTNPGIEGLEMVTGNEVYYIYQL